MATTYTVTKEKVTEDDLNTGTSTVTVTLSDGTTQSQNQINASSIPIKDTNAHFVGTTTEVALAEAKSSINSGDTLTTAQASISSIADATNANIVNTAEETHFLGGLVICEDDINPALLKIGITIDGGSEATYEFMEPNATTVKRFAYIPPIYAATSLNVRIKNTTGGAVVVCYQAHYKT